MTKSTTDRPQTAAKRGHSTAASSTVSDIRGCGWVLQNGISAPGNVAWSHALLILACSATKRHDAGLLPAIDRYDGPAYRTLRLALRQRIGLRERLVIRILSAEYGLFDADTPIPSYNRRMTPKRANELFPTVMPAYLELCSRGWQAIHISLGKDYWQAVRRPFPGAAIAEGGIGERLAQLKTWLWSVALEDQK